MSGIRKTRVFIQINHKYLKAKLFFLIAVQKKEGYRFHIRRGILLSVIFPY